MATKDQLQIVSILPSTGINRCYSYVVDPADHFEPGTYVKISLGRQETVGVIWDDTPDDVPLSKIKKVLCTYDAPPMSSEMRRYIEKVAEWTMSPRGSILKMAVPSTKLLDEPKRPLKFICTNIAYDRHVALSEDQQMAANFLSDQVKNGSYGSILLDGVTGARQNGSFL